MIRLFDAIGGVFRAVRRRWAVAGLAAVALGLVAAMPAAQAKVEGDTITLGFVLSFSGTYEINGINILKGYEIAVKFINAAGGVKVRGKKHNLALSYYDDQSSPAEAAKLAERLIDRDGIKFILGPYSSTLTKAVARVTEQYKVPLVAAGGASTSLFDHGDKCIFGLFSTSDQYLKPVVELAVKKAENDGLNPKDLTLAIAVQNDRFSLHVRAAVVKDAKRYGIKAVIDDILPAALNDMSATLEKVRREKPDILVISGHSKSAETATRQIREMGIKAPSSPRPIVNPRKSSRNSEKPRRGFIAPPSGLSRSLSRAIYSVRQWISRMR